MHERGDKLLLKMHKLTETSENENFLKLLP